MELGAAPGQEAARSQAPAQQSAMQERPGEGQQAAGDDGQQPAEVQDVQQSSTEHHLLDRDDLHSPQQPGNPQAAVQELPNHHERPPGEAAGGAAHERLQSSSQAGPSPDPSDGASGASPSGSPHIEGPAGAGAAWRKPAETTSTGPTCRQAGSKGPHHRLHSSVGSAAQPWVDALVGLLLLQLLPCGCLWGVGWLVHQLLGPRALSPLHWQLAEQVCTGCWEWGPETTCLCTALFAQEQRIVGRHWAANVAPQKIKVDRHLPPMVGMSVTKHTSYLMTCRPVC